MKKTMKNTLTDDDLKKLIKLTSAPDADYSEFKTAINNMIKQYGNSKNFEKVNMRIFNNILINKNIDKNKKFSYCNFLISQGIAPNFKVNNENLESPLLYAIVNKNVEVIKLFLENGADPNAKSTIYFATKGQEESAKKRIMPLLFVAEHLGNEQISGLLLNHGADVNSRDSKNLSIIGYIVEIKLHRLTYDEMKDKARFYCDYGYNLNHSMGAYNKPLADYVKFFIAHSKEVKTLDEFKDYVNDWGKFSKKLEKSYKNSEKQNDMNY